VFSSLKSRFDLFLIVPNLGQDYFVFGSMGFALALFDAPLRAINYAIDSFNASARVDEVERLKIESDTYC
jgi:hypothetical protein